MYLNPFHLKSQIDTCTLLLLMIGFSSCEMFKTKYNVSGRVTQNGERFAKAVVFVKKRSGATDVISQRRAEP